MTVREALKKTGWEYVINSQYEAWEVDSLLSDYDAEWLNNEATFDGSEIVELNSDGIIIDCLTEHVDSEE